MLCVRLCPIHEEGARSRPTRPGCNPRRCRTRQRSPTPPDTEFSKTGRQVFAFRKKNRSESDFESGQAWTLACTHWPLRRAHSDIHSLARRAGIRSGVELEVLARRASERISKLFPRTFRIHSSWISSVHRAWMKPACARRTMRSRSGAEDKTQASMIAVAGVSINIPCPAPGRPPSIRRRAGGGRRHPCVCKP